MLFQLVQKLDEKSFKTLQKQSTAFMRFQKPQPFSFVTKSCSLGYWTLRCKRDIYKHAISKAESTLVKVTIARLQLVLLKDIRSLTFINPFLSQY